jgi:hypothetical protein
MALAKVDSKGRISLPREIHEILGDTVELKPLGRQGVLLSRAIRTTNKRARSGREDFARLLDKEPKRSGKPENPSPEEMKSIWE